MCGCAKVTKRRRTTKRRREDCMVNGKGRREREVLSYLDYSRTPESDKQCTCLNGTKL